MDISFNTIEANLNLHIGYGLAGFNMVTALQRLGHRVPFKDPDCPVEIAFNQPIYTEWSNKDQYRIQYTPWESTALPDGWLKGFNEADEVWTPSPLIAKWYAEAGVVKPVHVYEHGIDHSWKNTRRKRDGVLKFLHHGEPAPRKGGQMALDAFREAFGDRDDVHLTIKSHGSANVRNKDKRGNIVGTVNSIPNVTLLESNVQESELRQMYQDHHVMVYPGYGEGFGLIPLQALATGMPTICTGAWAPYNRFLLPEFTLGAELVDSPWKHMHPGKVFEPDFEQLVEAYLYADAEYDKAAGKAYRNGFKVHEEYDWDVLTKDAFAHIVEKFS